MFAWVKSAVKFLQDKGVIRKPIYEFKKIEGISIGIVDKDSDEEIKDKLNAFENRQLEEELKEMSREEVFMLGGTDRLKQYIPENLAKGKSFMVVRRSKTVFNISPVNSEED